MKFLTICQGGNVRSVALAFVLKYGYGQDAIAASWEANSSDTLRMLARWADFVILMQAEMLDKMPDLNGDSSKVRVFDVGEDHYGTPFHPQLQDVCKSGCAEWSTRDWLL